MQSDSRRKRTHKLNINVTRTAHLERLDEITERSDGAYTSAFASWANGWRALQWQERQRVAETQRWVNIRKAV